jgi:hypothetical protein
MDNRSLGCAEFYFGNSYGRKPYVVGAKRGAGCKNTYPLVSAQSWRAYGRTGFLIDFRESPNKPDIIKSFKSSQSFRGAPSGRKDNFTSKLRDNAALTRYAELGGERRMKMCNRKHYFVLELQISG